MSTPTAELVWQSALRTAASNWCREVFGGKLGAAAESFVLSFPPVTADQRQAHNMLLAMHGARKPGTSDKQTEFSERLEFALVLNGAKPSFFALGEDGDMRPNAWTSIAQALSSPPLWGVTEGQVHHRYRAYRIGDRQLLQAVESRSRNVLPMFWMTTDPVLAGLYREGRPADVDDATLLGYPACCAMWHFDAFFARGIEAFCAVMLASSTVTRSAEYIGTQWSPAPGYFLPQEYFLAAILRSNVKFPHVSHTACPACLAEPDSPTLKLDTMAAELGCALDPNGLASLDAWRASRAKLAATIVASKNEIIDREIASLELNIREEDIYRRHARHLVKALEL